MITKSDASAQVPKNGTAKSLQVDQQFSILIFSRRWQAVDLPSCSMANPGCRSAGVRQCMSRMWLSEGDFG